MVTIKVDIEDLETLVGRGLPRSAEDLNELLSYLKCEVAVAYGTGELSLELKDTNRPDLWSAEGIARAIKGLLGTEVGLKKYSLEREGGLAVNVDRGLKRVRPFIGCAVVRGLDLNGTIIRGLIQLQDKLDQSYGRRRRRASIGFYDYALITPPVTYGVAEPDEVSFVPLDSSEEMTLAEILEGHPKGIEYGHIVKPYRRWPILIDSENRVLSFPPIINSNDLGKITEDTRDVMVEVTGTSLEAVLNTLTILVVALADRGGRIHPAAIRYPQGQLGTVKTPKLETSKVKLNINYVNGILGIDLSPKQIIAHLRRARFGVQGTGRVLKVEVPCYRLDVMHPIDIVEDVAIYYGLNRMKSRWPAYSTVGGLRPEEEFASFVRELMMGFGFQEVLTYSLTSPEKLFTRMRMDREEVIEVMNPRISTMVCLRSWLLPSLMEVLSYNIHVPYPQKVFEVAYCVKPDPAAENRAREVRKLACVSIHALANYTEARSYLDPLMLNLGVGHEIRESSHPSFIEGRIGEILVGGKAIGIIGEIHPQVLENWGLENPAAAFEIDLEQLMTLRHRALNLT